MRRDTFRAITLSWEKWSTGRYRLCRLRAKVVFVKPQGGRPIDLHEVAKILRAKDLCDVERHLREKGCPEFEYEGELADWALLWERGCLDF